MYSSQLARLYTDRAGLLCDNFLHVFRADPNTSSGRSLSGSGASRSVRRVTLAGRLGVTAPGFDDWMHGDSLLELMCADKVSETELDQSFIPELEDE